MMAFEWAVKDCKCRCGNEFRDLVNLTATVRYTAHKHPRVRQECNTCLCARIGQGQSDVYRAISSKLVASLVERGAISREDADSISRVH